MKTGLETRDWRLEIRNQLIGNRGSDNPLTSQGVDELISQEGLRFTQ